jgi:hypothetical protein
VAASVRRDIASVLIADNEWHLVSGANVKHEARLTGSARSMHDYGWN